VASGSEQGTELQLPKFKAANNHQWLKHAQEIMSSTASNYDITKLATGQTIAAGALLFASAAACPTIITSLKTCSPILAVTLLYGIMMFASSYVEEEQHFWYWATTAWLTLLWIKS
jgi:ethanolaminephosphotransferase